jgi:RND family efflux transporter MFP subunit
MNVQRIISIVAGISIFGVAVVLWARPEPEPITPRPDALKRVQVSRAEESVFHREVRFPGITRAAQRAVLSFGVPGRIAIGAVDLGQTVNTGDLISRLDDAQFRNAVKSAEAQLAEITSRADQADRDRQRMTHLVGEKAGTAEELEKVTASHKALQAGVSAARAQLSEARRQLCETVLKAPFSGTITAVLAEPGEWASPGRPVVEISGTGDLELVVQVPETVFTKIRKDQTVQIEFPFAHRSRVSGHIVSVSEAASGAGRLFPVLIRLPSQSGLSAGLTVELIITIAIEKQISVPFKAIVNPGASRPALFRLVEGRAERVAVELGQITDDRVAIKGAVNVGDWVVVAGHTSLTHGAAVEVRQ